MGEPLPRVPIEDATAILRQEKGEQYNPPPKAQYVMAETAEGQQLALVRQQYHECEVCGGTKLDPRGELPDDHPNKHPLICQNCGDDESEDPLSRSGMVYEGEIYIVP